VTDEPRPLDRRTFEAQQLMQSHSPIWHHPNKQAVFEIACPPGSPHRGQLEYTRWPAMALPDAVDLAGVADLVESREDVYDYAPLPGSADAVEWHVNFADPHLFIAYGSSLLAQDELQVVEHPSLGALREALNADQVQALTVERGRPTPVLVLGAERRCRLATDPNAAEGRPGGLYGNAFARADVSVVRRATSRIEPATISNLIAIAAPFGGYGPYSRAEIAHVLATAYSGFRAAGLESSRIRGATCPTVVHTGFWGCGAFGGNRELMAILQVTAARMAGVSRLVFHTFGAAGTEALAAALEAIEEDLLPSPAVKTSHLIEAVAGLGLEWGESDGN
jgi:hypothetical protein